MKKFIKVSEEDITRIVENEYCAKNEVVEFINFDESLYVYEIHVIDENLKEVKS